MNEAHFDEIERTLMNISGARRRAVKACEALSDNAEPHLGEALQEAAAELEQLHRRLMQKTYFAVPSEESENRQQSKLVA